MKRIRVQLTPQSVEQAIQKLEKAKSQLVEMYAEFLTECANVFVSKAKANVLKTDIGDKLKEKINMSWVINNDKKHLVTIKNKNNKAVYVEFGVGRIGSSFPHPNATETNYEYDVDSEHKDENGEWRFFTKKDNLDLPKSSISYMGTYNDKYGRGGKDKILVVTMGTQGAMFAYNALMDLRLEIPKIWENIKRKYWK